MRTAGVRWTPAQRGIIDATTAALGLGLGNPDRVLPRDPEGLLTRLEKAADDPYARRDLLSCLAGPAKVGLDSIAGRLGILEAGMFATLEHMDRVAIPNARAQAREDAECADLIPYRQGLRKRLANAGEAVRAQIAVGK